MGVIGINGKMLGGQPGEDISSTFGSVVFNELHESTSPAAIALDQRRDVLDAYRRGYRTGKQISKLLWLEIWVVRRRMYELGIGPNPITKLDERPVRNAESVIPKIVEILIVGPRLASEIAAEVKIPVQSCLSILRASNRFVSIRIGSESKPRLQWRLKVEPVQDSRTPQECVS